MLRRLAEQIRLRKYPPIIRAVRRDSLTYLRGEPLNELYEAVQRLEQKQLEGVLIEAGCALGGSAIVMATAKAPSRPFYVYDVFGMIPAPSHEDGSDVHQRYETIRRGDSRGIGGNKYYGYEDDLLGKVQASFRNHGVPIEANNVHLIQGLFQETIQLEESVALAHIDGDWYESVMTCLDRLVPHLVRGGVLVIDDYLHWTGCRKAVDEYFADKKAEFEFVMKSRLHIVRQA